MLRRLLLAVIVADILLFALTAGALAYLAQNSMWSPFFGVLTLATVLYTLLQVQKSKPIQHRLEQLEKSQFELLTRFREFGIQEIFNMQEPVQQDRRNHVTREIIQRGYAFSLLSQSAASYFNPSVHRHWPYIKSKLDEGSPFRLLLLNPFCREKEIRNRINALSDRGDSKLGLDTLTILYNRYPNLDIRLSSYNIYCAVFFTQSEMIYDPYHLGKAGDAIENNFFALHITTPIGAPHGHAYYSLLRAHFDFLWNTAQPLEVFVQEHTPQLQAAGLQSLQPRNRYTSLNEP